MKREDNSSSFQQQWVSPTTLAEVFSQLEANKVRTPCMQSQQPSFLHPMARADCASMVTGNRCHDPRWQHSSRRVPRVARGTSHYQYQRRPRAQLQDRQKQGTLIGPIHSLSSWAAFASQSADSNFPLQGGLKVGAAVPFAEIICELEKAVEGKPSPAAWQSMAAHLKRIAGAIAHRATADSLSLGHCAPWPKKLM